MRWLRSSLTAGLLLVAACVATAEIPPATGQYDPAERDRVLARAAAVLEQRGYAIELTDPFAGLLVTKPRASQMKAREIAQVCLNDDGTAVVSLDGETLAPGTNRWAPITVGEEAEAIGRKQEQLRDEILGKRLSASR